MFFYVCLNEILNLALVGFIGIKSSFHTNICLFLLRMMLFFAISLNKRIVEAKGGLKGMNMDSCNQTSYMLKYKINGMR